MFRNDRLRCRYSLQKTRQENSVARLNKTLRKNSSKRAYELVKDLTTVKQGKATSVQDRLGKCFIKEREILNRWTEYCSELYNHKADGNPSVLKCPKTHTEHDHPILRKEVETTVQSLKKGKSAGFGNIPAELVQAGGEDVITAFTTICNKIWQRGEWPTPWAQTLVVTLPKERQPAAVPELPNDQPHQPPKQSYWTDRSRKQKKKKFYRTGRLQSRKEYHRAGLQPKNSL